MQTENPDLADNPGYQLRVRISTEERDAIDKLRNDRGKDENVSDIVRVAIHLLIEGRVGVSASTVLEKKINVLASLLKREPHQVKQACVEGIFDLIENKTRVPLIVMESHLHLSYGSAEGIRPFSF